MKPWRLFVYGTLKRGERNHARHCAGARDRAPATIAGRLYHLTAGYPMLWVPAESVRRLGSADRDADLDLDLDNRAWFEAQRIQYVDRSGAGAFARGEQLAHGELFTFDREGGPQRLEGLDGLEGFDPPHRCHYHRVVVEVLAQEPVLAWTYIAPHGILPVEAEPVPLGQWPPT